MMIISINDFNENLPLIRKDIKVFQDSEQSLLGILSLIVVDSTWNLNGLGLNIQC